MCAACALVPMGKEENTHQAENTEHSLLKKGLQGRHTYAFHFCTLGSRYYFGSTIVKARGLLNLLLD